MNNEVVREMLLNINKRELEFLKSIIQDPPMIVDPVGPNATEELSEYVELVMRISKISEVTDTKTLISSNGYTHFSTILLLIIVSVYSTLYTAGFFTYYYEE